MPEDSPAPWMHRPDVDFLEEAHPRQCPPVPFRDRHARYNDRHRSTAASTAAGLLGDSGQFTLTSRSQYLDDYRKAFGDAGDEVWHLERGQGAVLISDNGCGLTGWLIVVGLHRGEVRDRDCEVNPPFEQYLDATGNRHTFGTWYLERLEQRERATR
ncbi:hypothetical protein AB0F92_39830 [Kitasatospora aureofaciens]|uniref:hypothetical protein n=1 Tax=Kitasatospora aureofaciens TaxID=1894 RepID=UPI003410C3E6